jgi:hypothetical protein
LRLIMQQFFAQGNEEYFTYPFGMVLDPRADPDRARFCGVGIE